MSGHNTGAVLDGKVCRRGTSNGNDRGNSTDRRRRREYLVETYRADVEVVLLNGARIGTAPAHAAVPYGYERVPACRCYRCGELLTVDTVTVDRIIPGCQGGSYRRNNIRPACGDCNSETGGALAGRGRRRS